MTVDIITPKPRLTTELDPTPVQLPVPEDLEEVGRGAMMMKIVMALMAVFMVAMLIMMMKMGLRRFNPYMLMIVGGMFLSAVTTMGGGGTGGHAASDVDTTRNRYLLDLREKRKLAHANGRKIHSLQSLQFPNPKLLWTLVGTGTMWQAARATGNSDPAGRSRDGSRGDAPPPSSNPYMRARIGVGMVRMWKPIKRAKAEAPETKEPLTSLAHDLFVRNQNWIPNSPVSQNLTSYPFYGYTGDQEMIAGLGRAMMCSLAYNHSPMDLVIGVVSPSITDPRGDWEWAKWLPHMQDQFRTDAAGPARNAWASLDDFCSDNQELIVERGPRGGAFSGTYMVVFVDAPGEAITRPLNLPASGVNGVTFVSLRCKSENMSDEETSRFGISAEDGYRTITGKRVPVPDTMSILDADVFARKMSRYLPKGWGSLSAAAASAASASSGPDMDRGLFNAMGIGDINTYDPRPLWKKNEQTSSFKIPIGFFHDGTKVVDEYVYLDITDAARGGTGPHGVAQGKTGAGKSVFLTGFVEMLCHNYGPQTLNLILMDFKGGSSFPLFEKFPHVIANITNLADSTDLVERATDVIAGEIQKRQTLFNRHGATDIFEYRKMYFREPGKYPRLPELVIIGDEYGELMADHREYVQVFTQIARVGRSLGIHALPTSQVVDPALLGDTFSKQITYGISYHVGSEGESRHVIKNGEAAHLPFGSYRAILMYNDPVEGVMRKQFIAFNTDAKYVPVDHEAEVVDIDGSAEELIVPFRLAPIGVAAIDDAEDENVEEDPKWKKAADVENKVRVKNIYLDRISQFDEVKAEPLWLPTLVAPISFAEVGVDQAQSSALEFTIGITDDPYNHARHPYVVRPGSGGEHIKILGTDHSGRSTAIQAMVMSSALAYPPSLVSWHLIDYGGTKLREVATSPNVGGYAVRTDTDGVDRLIAESLRIRRLRERLFSERELTSLDDYFQSRAATPVPDDPYGHIFLAIDGYTSYLTDHEEDRDTLMDILDGGGRYGLHLVITAKDEIRKLNRHASYFGTMILLKVDDHNMLQSADRDTKTLVSKIPDRQPGRCVDPKSRLMARILVPQRAKIEPTGFDEDKRVYKYDSDADYGPGIKALADELRQMYVDQGLSANLAVPVETAPPVIDFDGFWAAYESVRKVPELTLPNGAPKRRQMDVTTPIGVSCEDLTIAPRPFNNPHLVVAGDIGCGKTSFLIGTINAIVRQYRPDEAQIVIADTKFSLLSCRDVLRETGYLLGYADNPDKFATVMADVARVIDPRFPQDDTDLSTDKLRGQSWYSGPDIFVLIDDAHLLYKGGAGGFGASRKEAAEDIIARLTTRPDIGLHVYATITDSKFPIQRNSNKLLDPLTRVSAPLLLMSGSRDEGSVVSRVKFAKRRPGQGLFCDLSIPDKYYEVVQTPYALPWDVEGAAPSQTIIDAAKAVAASMDPVVPPASDDTLVAETPAEPRAATTSRGVSIDPAMDPTKRPNRTPSISGSTGASVKSSSGRSKDDGKSFKWGV